MSRFSERFVFWDGYLRNENERYEPSCRQKGGGPYPCVAPGTRAYTAAVLVDILQSDQLRSKIEHLKMSHAELTMDCTGVKKKIDQARGEKPL